MAALDNKNNFAINSHFNFFNCFAAYLITSCRSDIPYLNVSLYFRTFKNIVTEKKRIIKGGVFGHKVDGEVRRVSDLKLTI